MTIGFRRGWVLALAAAALAIMGAASPAFASHDHEGNGDRQAGSPGDGHVPQPTLLAIPIPDPRHGKELFVSKGCVVCHSVNGVGGHDAPPLDAHTMNPVMSPLDFAARMWRGAAAMIYAQEEELGAQIEFDGGELGDIISFLHNDALQHTFTDGDLTVEARKLMGHEHDEPVGQREDEQHGH